MRYFKINVFLFFRGNWIAKVRKSKKFVSTEGKDFRRSQEKTLDKQTTQ